MSCPETLSAPDEHFEDMHAILGEALMPCAETEEALAALDRAVEAGLPDELYAPLAGAMFLPPSEREEAVADVFVIHGDELARILVPA